MKLGQKRREKEWTIKQESREGGEGSWGYSKPLTDDSIHIVWSDKRKMGLSRLQYNSGSFWLALQIEHILHLYLIQVN